MTVRTTAGSVMRITAAKPATFTESGYEAVFPIPITSTNPLVGEITDFGEFGREYNLTTHNPVGDRGTVKLKGSFNAGQMNLQLGLDGDDSGQNMLKTAANSDADYYFEITIQSGERYYFPAKVMNFKTNLGSVDSVTSANVTLELTSYDGVDIIEAMPV